MFLLQIEIQTKTVLLQTVDGKGFQKNDFSHIITSF
jgi:hypothetical protein